MMNSGAAMDNLSMSGDVADDLKKAFTYYWERFHAELVTPIVEAGRPRQKPR